jgi:hypothetical protein
MLREQPRARAQPMSKAATRKAKLEMIMCIATEEVQQSLSCKQSKKEEEKRTSIVSGLDYCSNHHI